MVLWEVDASLCQGNEDGVPHTAATTLAVARAAPFTSADPDLIVGVGNTTYEYLRLVLHQRVYSHSPKVFPTVGGAVQPAQWRRTAPLRKMLRWDLCLGLQDVSDGHASRSNSVAACMQLP